MRFIEAIVVRAQNEWFAVRNEQDGQTLVEYALIIAIIAIGAIVALGVLSGEINNLFGRTANELKNAPN